MQTRKYDKYSVAERTAMLIIWGALANAVCIGARTQTSRGVGTSETATNSGMRRASTLIIVAH